MKFLTLVFLLAYISNAFGGEGFFKKEQLQLNFSLEAIEPASLMVEEFQADTRTWKHIGNAFYVSEKGFILTNYHIAQSCVYSSRSFFRSKYKSPSELSAKGFNADTLDGIPCHGLRVSGLRVTGSLAVNLVFLPKVPQASQDGLTAQEADGYYHDIAILKLSESLVLEKGTWFPLKSVSEEEMTVGTPVYQVGYPGYTQRAENSELIKNKVYEEVKTGDYRISTGEILEVKPEYYYQPKKELYIYASTDGGMGTSGSALVNSKGTLIGLILGSGSAENSTKFVSCVPHFQYCPGVSLYLKMDPLIQILKAENADLAKEIVAE